MSKTTTISAVIGVVRKAQLSRIAKSTGLTQTQVISALLDRYGNRFMESYSKERNEALAELTRQM